VAGCSDQEHGNFIVRQIEELASNSFVNFEDLNFINCKMEIIDVH
jgi:hypothetical protein